MFTILCTYCKESGWRIRYVRSEQFVHRIRVEIIDNIKYLVIPSSSLRYKKGWFCNPKKMVHEAWISKSTL